MRLFTPIRVGAQELHNRVLMAPMATGYAEPDGSVSARLLEFYRVRGAGGAAAVIVGSALVDPAGRGMERQLAAYDDRYMPGLGALARAIQEGGARAWLQLTHAGRQTTAALAGQQPVAPSAIAAAGGGVLGPARGAAADRGGGDGSAAPGGGAPEADALSGQASRAAAVAGDELPRALSRAEVERVVEAFAAAARRAAVAGFDGVEIQAARGELLHQFLSPLANRRRDRYGRTPAGRARVAQEVVRRTRRAVGEGMVVSCQISADDRVPGGLTQIEARAIARLLEEAGVDTLHVSAGTEATFAELPLAAGTGEGTLAALAAGIKAAVERTPVIAVGRLLSSEMAEKLLQDGSADLAAVGRAFLADPHWARKVAEGREDEITPCIGILGCLMGAGEPGTGCSINPEVGHEWELEGWKVGRLEGSGVAGVQPSNLPTFQPSNRPRRIGILGAGPPALEAARVAAARGHQVTLWVGELPIGGLLGLRAGVPGNAEFGRVILRYGQVLRELGVRPAEEAPTLEEIDILLDGRPGPAIAPSWAAPSEEGKLWLAADVLQRDLLQLIPLGRRIAVIGDGAIAAETALFFAGWGRRPTVIAATETPFADVHPMFAHELRRRLEGYKVAIERGVEVLRWEWPPRQPHGRLLGRRDSQETELAPFHSVVLAPDWTPRGPLEPLPDGPPPDGSTYVLGDSTRPDTLRDLTVYAMRLARRL